MKKLFRKLLRGKKAREKVVSIEETILYEVLKKSDGGKSHVGSVREKRRKGSI